MAFQVRLLDLSDTALDLGERSVTLGRLALDGGAARLTKAVDALRVNGDNFSAQQTVSRAGSRSIPYLVSELEPGNDKQWLVVVSHELTFLVNGLEETGHFEALPDRRIPTVLIKDSAEEVTKKCGTVRTWWQESSGDYPPAWQFWTGRKQR
jgi:hypothetical protein